MNTQDRYNGSLTLRRRLGMRGYGVYSRIVELVVSAPQKRIKYDLDDLAFDMNEDKEFIRKVVEEYGLFEIKDDGFLEDPYAKTPEALAKERAEQVHINRVNGAKKAAATRKAKREAEQAAAQVVKAEIIEPERQVVEPTKTSNVLSPFVEPTPTQETVDDASRKFDRVVDEWNKIFKRTRREYTALTPDSITWNNFVGSSRRYEVEDFRDAFKQAYSEQFVWQFKDAIKPSNMQRLLSNFEAKKQQEEPVDFEVQEVIEYAERKGYNWKN